MLGINSIKYFIFLLWVSFVYFSAIFIFTSGFLLRRQVLSNRTECSGSNCHGQPAQVFSKAVILLVDALKYDFCVYDANLTRPGHSDNKLPVVERLTRPVTPGSGHSAGKLYRFMADPPTTTMQRLKGLTTGSLPTFIDVSSNFASYEVSEDNIVDQLVRAGRRVVFAGDDTWTHLYPDTFTRQYPQPSFDVWDLDTVDREVARVLNKHLKTPDKWDVFIGHFLGVDHAGHKYGPHHPEMARKLGEMNNVIEHVVRELPRDTLLLVFGDHGMTGSGDHGGDSDSEVTAGLMVYSPLLAIPAPATDTVSTVAQIDLVPTLSLLLGVPIPFSNLGAIIEDLFIPTSLFKDIHPSKRASFSSEDLINFRLPFIKNNVHQVHRYLTAYLAAGGSFPEAANSRIRQLASQVINKPGALNHRQLQELVRHSRSFLSEARAMCQSVWVEFNTTAMSHSLNILLLHTCVIIILVFKPSNRLLTMLISILGLVLSLATGSFIGVTIFCVTGFSFYPLVIGCAAAVSTVSQGLVLLWRLRHNLVDTVRTTLTSLLDMETLALVTIYIFTLLINFSNSFVILQAQTINFLLVSILMMYLYKLRRCEGTGLACSAIILAIGLSQVSMMYVRCREEQGPDCPPTDFHKPLSTLPQSAGYYKNWRYGFTCISLLVCCLALHRLLSRGGNLNGISVPVLVAGYCPWIITLLMVSYWALQSFPHKLISQLLPWQQNILALGVLVIANLGLITLVINPLLVYLIPKKRLINKIFPKQDNVSTYFNYLKTNWKTSLGEDTANPMNVAYGLGTCLSSVVISITCLLSLVSMLLLGDGQAPALCLHIIVSGLILLVTSPPRLCPTLSTSSVFRVPLPLLLLWSLQDSLAFYTTGHQPTFPHIQWSAAFVGFAGTEYGGDSLLGHIVPALLVGWNTYSTAIISGVSLPLLLLAPAMVWLHAPSLRPRTPHTNGVTHGHHDQLIGHEDFHSELMKGEVLYLDRVEETRAAMMLLCCQYIVLRAGKMIMTTLAAAVLRRHLMVWKIFAPNFIFEAVGFMVSVISVILGFIIFSRCLSVLNKWYCKIQKM